MDFNRLRTVEEFVIEVRTTLGLDNHFDNMNVYQPLTFDYLSENIMHAYPNIKICNTNGAKLKYYVKNKKTYIEIPKDLDAFSILKMLASGFGAYVLDEYTTSENVKEYMSIFMYALILPRALFYKVLDMFADYDATVIYQKMADTLCLPDKFVITRGRHLMVW
jgi:hypothetical protein